MFFRQLKKKFNTFQAETFLCEFFKIFLIVNSLFQQFSKVETILFHFSKGEKLSSLLFIPMEKYILILFRGWKNYFYSFQTNEKIYFNTFQRVKKKFLFFSNTWKKNFYAFSSPEKYFCILFNCLKNVKYLNGTTDDECSSPSLSGATDNTNVRNIHNILNKIIILGVIVIVWKA